MSLPMATTPLAPILPDPAYTILAPSNAVLTITDAGTKPTPIVIITNPASYVVFLEPPMRRLGAQCHCH